MKIKVPVINRFSALVFLCVAVLAVVMGFALSTFLTRAVSEWEGESTAAFVKHQVEMAGFDALFTAPRDAETQERWAEELPRIVGILPGVVRCKVWDREGTILWSENATVIGQRSPGNPDLRAALAGKVVSEVTELSPDEPAQEGEEFRTLAHVYVPVISKGTKEVLGVLEIYRTPGRLFAALRWGLFIIWGISLGGGVVLSLIFLPLARQLYGRQPRGKRGFEAVSTRTADEIRGEIVERFGFFPPFFEPALEAPQVLENLWQQTLSAYVENPFPALFKEKLFAYLSRYCSIPYCIICHSCALRPLGMSAAEVLTLLESPPPAEPHIAEYVRVLVAEPAPLAVWPDPGSPVETALTGCSVFMFLHQDQAEHCHAEMRRLLGHALYSRLIEFLGYVKTCHFWVETHPELVYEADRRAQEHLGPLLAEEPRLLEFFRDYGEKVKRERRRREEAD